MITPVFFPNRSRGHTRIIINPYVDRFDRRWYCSLFPNPLWTAQSAPVTDAKFRDPRGGGGGGGGGGHGRMMIEMVTMSGLRLPVMYETDFQVYSYSNSFTQERESKRSQQRELMVIEYLTKCDERTTLRPEAVTSRQVMT